MIAEVVHATCSLCGDATQVIVDLRDTPESPICIFCCLDKANTLAWANEGLRSALGAAEAALAEAQEKLAELCEAASNTCRFLQRNVGGLDLLADYGRSYASSLMAAGAEGYDEAALAATGEGGEAP